jgi:hypothetical protein
MTETVRELYALLFGLIPVALQPEFQPIATAGFRSRRILDRASLALWPDLVTGFGFFFLVVLAPTMLLILGLRAYGRDRTTQ